LYEVPRSPAIFANHSCAPNPVLEFWPAVEKAGSVAEESAYEPGGFWMVATEAIPEGGEVRINYEGGKKRQKHEHTFWGEETPQETPSWRDARVAPPPLPAGLPPSTHLALVGALEHVLAAERDPKKPLSAELRQKLDAIYPLPLPPLPWQELDPRTGQLADRGDTRLRRLAPELMISNRRCFWGVLATHIPGRSGYECYQRWQLLRESSDRPPDELSRWKKKLFARDPSHRKVKPARQSPAGAGWGASLASLLPRGGAGVAELADARLPQRTADEERALFCSSHGDAGLVAPP